MSHSNNCALDLTIRILKDPMDIITLSPEEIARIPKDVLIERCENYIRCVYDRLPEYWQSDSEILMCMPCHVHHNTALDHTHFDGPNPLRKYCKQCVSKLNKLRQRMCTK